MLLISAGYVCKKDLRQFRNQEGERRVAEHLDKYLHACVLSHFSRVQLHGTLRPVARQAPLSMGLFRQESWSELLCPPPGDLPDPGIEAVSPVAPALQVDYWGSPVSIYSFSNQRGPESAVVPRCFDGERLSDVPWTSLWHIRMVGTLHTMLTSTFSASVFLSTFSLQEQSNFFLLWLSSYLQGMFIILAKSWFGALGGLETSCVDSGSPENPEISNRSLVTDCNVVMILNYC